MDASIPLHHTVALDHPIFNLWLIIPETFNILMKSALIDTLLKLPCVARVLCFLAADSAVLVLCYLAFEIDFKTLNSFLPIELCLLSYH